MISNAGAGLQGHRRAAANSPRDGQRPGHKATAGVLLERTSHPGVYRRGLQYVAVYRRGGRQRKEFAATFDEARSIKLKRDAEAKEERRGPTLHAYALAWVGHHAGSGRDAVREQIRTEYQRLLATFTLSYFPTSVRLTDLDRRALQGFIGWLTDRPWRNGRLSDRSIRNALTPLRLCLDAAVNEGVVSGDLTRTLVLPARRGGRRWDVRERRSLNRDELARLLEEIPPNYQALFSLLASTGLRISEAIGLRWCDLDLDASPPYLRPPGDCRGRHWCAEVALRRAYDPADRRSRSPATRNMAFGWRYRRPGLPEPPRTADRTPHAEKMRPRTGGHPRRRAGHRTPHAAPHMRLVADRAGHQPAAPTALDGASRGCLRSKPTDT
jgi:integrase